MRIRGNVSALLSLLSVAAYSGCSGDSANQPASTHPQNHDPACKLDELILADGSCLRPGVDTSTCAEGFSSTEPHVCRPILPAAPCPEGTLPVLGKTECQPVGIPSNACAPGFDFDNEGGCSPILPVEPCAAGMMAVPGDASCREVAPCGSGTWGDIPVDVTTVYVDQSYSGSAGPSDGSVTRPFTAIQPAIDAAASGAIVAIAAGSYAEGLKVYNKPVTLWGVCPAKVEIVGPSDGYAAIDISSANGAEVHDLAVRGLSPGNVGVYGSVDVKLDRLWIHDGNKGIYAEKYAGVVTHGIVSRSLIESNDRFGLQCAGVEFEIEATEIRDTRHVNGSNPSGWGVSAQPKTPSGPVASVWVRGSRIENNEGVGIMSLSSMLDVDATVVRSTRSVNDSNGLGNGIAMKIPLGGTTPPTLSLKRSYVENNSDIGVAIQEATATVSHTVVRGTQPSTKHRGFGVSVAVPSGALTPATLTLSDSLVAENYGINVVLDGGSATIERTIVSDALQSPLEDGSLSRGIGIQVDEASPDLPGNLHLVDSLIQRSAGSGIFSTGSPIDIRGTAVLDTRATADERGRAIEVDISDIGVARGSLTLERSVIDKGADSGVFAWGSDVVIRQSVVRTPNAKIDETTPYLGLYFQDSDVGQQPDLTIEDCSFEGSSSAQIAIFAARGEITRSSFIDGEFGIGTIVINGVLGNGTPDVQAEVKLSDSTLLFSHRYAIGTALSNTTLERVLVDGQGRAESNDVLGENALLIDDGGTSLIDRTLFANARIAGVLVYTGASTFTESGFVCTTLWFNAVDDGEISDGGGNECSCGDEPRHHCSVSIEKLSPPPPVEPLPRGSGNYTK